MKKPLFPISTGIIAIIILCLFLLANSCTLSQNQSPKISSLTADTLYVYPMAKAELQCVASAPQGDAVTFKWSSTEGTFTGTGPAVRWNAPNNYGKFHIMVIVEDSKGRSSKDTITIEVVPHENDQQGCSTCNRR
jgi:hypothetical protein